ncbi:MAG: hypothetical protein PHS02_02390 [Candidatus ainarchaeum sp.]|nr:hypothetical protein [Candidatus ainarchaeum sp.]
MNKLLLLPVLLILFAGCPGTPLQPPPQDNLTITTVNVSAFTITEETETIITGESVIIVNNTAENQTNITNRSISDYTYNPNQTLIIYFINVSYIPDWSQNAPNERQGEAILLKKGDADILIDAGPGERALYLVNFLRERGVDDIDLLISTHARPENYGGMDTLLDHIDVEMFLWPGYDGGDSDYAAVVQKARSKSRESMASDYLENISINGISFQVLNPRNGDQRFNSIDNDGIVLRITDRNFSMMTTGDIAYGAEAGIANSHDFNQSCRVLQIPNYGLGAGSAQIDMFLLKVHPESAIMTGSYFDPADERYSITERLRLKNISYYTNFENNGSNVVRITTDGYTYAISAQ